MVGIFHRIEPIFQRGFDQCVSLGLVESWCNSRLKPCVFPGVQWVCWKLCLHPIAKRWNFPRFLFEALVRVLRDETAVLRSLWISRMMFEVDCDFDFTWRNLYQQCLRVHKSKCIDRVFHQLHPNVYHSLLWGDPMRETHVWLVAFGHRTAGDPWLKKDSSPMAKWLFLF